MRITANHAHIFPVERRADGSISVLLNTMDKCNISECVTFATFHAFFDNFTDSTNRYMAKQIASHRDRLFGFGVVDFERDDVRDQVKEIADLGFYGIKLHPAFQHFNVLSEKALQVYEAAQKLDLFLSFHTGVHWDRIANYHPLLFDEIAYNYPQLRFSMEHIGGYSFFREALAVLTNSNRAEMRHVFGGLTSVFDADKPLWHLREEEIIQAVRQAGPDSIIFGIDFPCNNADRTRKDIEAVMALPIKEEEKEKILGGNLRKVLNIT